jgi:signal transduction histidine kinase
VFLNVLRNALKYSLPRYPPEPMVVRVLGQPQSGMQIVQVENWGIGIPAEQLDEIFQPFVRGRVADSTKVIRGMGLGLSVAKRILAGHGGDILCRRSRPTLDDRGRTDRYEGFETVFEVQLPVGLQPGLARHSLQEGLVYEVRR